MSGDSESPEEVPYIRVLVDILPAGCSLRYGWNGTFVTVQAIGANNYEGPRLDYMPDAEGTVQLVWAELWPSQ